MKRILLVVSVLFTSVVSSFAIDSYSFINSLLENGYFLDSEKQNYVKNEDNNISVIDISVSDTDNSKIVYIEQTYYFTEETERKGIFFGDISPMQLFPDFFNQFQIMPNSFIYKTDNYNSVKLKYINKEFSE